MQTANALEQRAYLFSLEALKFCSTLPRTHEAEVIHWQLPRSATGTVAQYRAARRARSRREFVALLGKAVEEVDERVLWLRLSVDSALGHQPMATRLLDEASELLRILAKSYATARANLQRSRRLARDQKITKSPDHQITK